MAIPDHDTATNWRELTDQLTPKQIVDLEGLESASAQCPDDPISGNQGVLNCARKMAELNICQAMFADVSLPAQVVGEVDEWCEWGDGYARTYNAWVREAGNLAVVVDGVQFDDGRVELSICVKCGTESLSADEAKHLAALLAEAAAAMERLR
ncbi:hypothetical protein AAHS21_23730 [Mycobacterium sp. 050272]|uniref:hypothetical protein n=1 Tax=Mycobacterium sp. 050272 TaxID=3142488 RepID=UPI0031856F8D